MMKRFTFWVQIVSTAGLFLGLIAVAYQLFQSEKIARYEIVAMITAAESSEFDVQIGENFSAVLSKLFTTPEKLSDAEIVQIMAFYDKFHSKVFYRKFFAQESLFTTNWKIFVGAKTSNVCYFFKNRLGRVWLDSFSRGDEIIAEMRSQLTSCGDLDGRRVLEISREALHEKVI